MALSNFTGCQSPSSMIMILFLSAYFGENSLRCQVPSCTWVLLTGQSEVVNRCLEQYPRCFVSQQPLKWSSFLPWAEFWYNITYHSSIGMTPFQALYGRLLPNIPNYWVETSPVHEIDQALMSRGAILQQLNAINRMKLVIDSKKREVEFEVGDYVFLLKLQTCWQQSVYRRVFQKFLWTILYRG